MSKINTTRQSEILRPTLRDAKGRHFGWVEPREQTTSRVREMHPFSLDLSLPLPAKVDLRPFCPAVYQQGNMNTCTANAVAALVHICRIKQAMSEEPPPSRLYIYWFERVLTNEQTADSGGSITDAVQATVENGYCLESLWPYVPGDLLSEPNNTAKDDAANRRIISPASLSTLQQIKASLASKNPVAFGLRIYNSFFAADGNGGIVPMPDQTGPCEGHAGVLVGYDDAVGRVTMRNSWGTVLADGTPCGDQGYYYLPYAYFDGSLASDFWSISSISA